jgi:hypothetical protein
MNARLGDVSGGKLPSQLLDHDRRPLTVEALPRGDQVQWRSKVIAERHGTFLQWTLYRLVAVLPANREADLFARGIVPTSGYFARSTCKLSHLPLSGPFLGTRILAFPCPCRRGIGGQATNNPWRTEFLPTTLTCTHALQM